VVVVFTVGLGCCWATGRWFGDGNRVGSGMVVMGVWDHERFLGFGMYGTLDCGMR